MNPIKCRSNLKFAFSNKHLKTRQKGAGTVKKLAPYINMSVSSNLEVPINMGFPTKPTSLVKTIVTLLSWSHTMSTGTNGTPATLLKFSSDLVEEVWRFILMPGSSWQLKLWIIFPAEGKKKRKRKMSYYQHNECKTKIK